MFVHAFRQIIYYYNRHYSQVFICFLDSDKVIGRVNHCTLVTKLIVRIVPGYIYWLTGTLSNSIVLSGVQVSSRSF